MRNLRSVGIWAGTAGDKVGMLDDMGGSDEEIVCILGCWMTLAWGGIPREGHRKSLLCCLLYSMLGGKQRKRESRTLRCRWILHTVMNEL